jgi:conjugative transfer region protein TrbK
MRIKDVRQGLHTLANTQGLDGLLHLYKRLEKTGSCPAAVPGMCRGWMANFGTSESSGPAADDKMDALAGELARCKVLGAEAARDPACKAAWAQNRARFLAPGVPYQDRSIDLFLATPDVPKAVPKIHLDRAPSTPQSDVGTPSTGPEGR